MGPFRMMDTIKPNVESAARNVMARINKEYFSLTKDEQEEFRANILVEDNDEDEIIAMLIGELFGIDCCGGTLSEYWDDFEPAQLTQIYWAQTLIQGIGDDNIVLKEGLTSARNLLNFPTLYDLDISYFLHEKTSRYYYAGQHSRSIHLLINGNFCDAKLCSLADFVMNTVRESGEQFIEELIPHRYVETEFYGFLVNGKQNWDVCIDAAGKEKQLDMLNTLWLDYLEERRLSLVHHCERMPPVVCVTEESCNTENSKYFIFSNQACLKAIRWRHFLQDCESLILDLKAVEDLIKKEVERARVLLSQSYRETIKADR